MDPIKVDFSKKGGPKEIVIPPDKAVLKIVLERALLAGNRSHCILYNAAAAQLQGV